MNPKNRPFNLVLLSIISLGAASAFAAAPTISGFSPASGILYSTVTITGTNFVAPVTVSFNGVASTSITVVSSTSVKAAVPATAATGVITLVASGGSANSASAFTVVPGVSASPAVGPPTTVTRLYYSGFAALELVDLYFDTGDIALSVASTSGAGNIPVNIPADGRPGVHWVTAAGRRSTNAAQVYFTVQTSWPQFGFVPSHKGKNRYENVLSPATVGDLDEAWRTPAIGGMESTPAVVNGIVYASFNGGTIRAFDETTGAQKWSYATAGSYMQSSPAVSNGIVYAGSDDHYLYALDAVTGALKWRFATGNAIYSSPTPANGIVYFGSDDNKVYALNATTGALVWSFGAGGAVQSSPMVANGAVYVGSQDDNIYALNAATGANIWHFPTMNYVNPSPVLVGGLVCVGSSDGNMYALQASTGAEVWAYSTGAAIESSAAAVGGALFFGNDDRIVYSLSSSGALRWSTTLPSDEAIESSPLCVANGVVYASAILYTHAFDQNSGALLTTLPVGSTSGGPAVVNGAVFCPDDNVGVLARYTPNSLQSGYVAPRPDPRQLRAHHLQ